MIKRIKNYSAPVLLLFLISCGDHYEEATIIKDLSSFHTLELNSVFDVYLLQDTTFAVKITGDEGVIDQIRFNVEEDTLSVSNESKRKWLNPEANKVKLYVSANRLQNIIINETCYIETIDPVIAENFNITIHPTPKLSHINLELNNNSFYYWNNHQCGGKLSLRGKTNKLRLYTFALMSVEAAQLSTDYAFIQNSSKGDCEVTVHEQLEYSILGAGNIYLHGAPKKIILKERTSTGQLILLD